MTSPGASSVPAKSEPIITVCAPAARALTMSPEYLMPPSEMQGTPNFAVARTQLSMAVICGTPTPATTRVVQMEPGPMPTFTASAPASQRAAGPVPPLPAAGPRLAEGRGRLAGSHVAGHDLDSLEGALQLADRLDH